MEKLNGGIPAGPVQNMADIFDDPHVAARQMLEVCQPGGDNPEISLAANPIRFNNTPTSLYHPSPTLGAHSEEVLEELGIKRRG